MEFNVITIFPDLVFHYCEESILGRAQKNNLIKINAVDLRDFAEDKHKKVDDTPYGGGPGMVMKPEPVFRALTKLRALKKSKIINQKPARHGLARGMAGGSKITILLSPRGKQFDQRMAEQFSKLKEITFVCGRYEGVDQRVVDYMVDEEVSVGPYVLAGGELGALVIIEAVARLLPWVLGNEESLSVETFNRTTEQQNNTRTIRQSVDVLEGCGVGVKEYPQYTKPAEFRGWKVPEVLLSGNHQRIQKWRAGSME